MSKAIRLQTNESNFYKNLGVIFSDKSKVLAELMQNGRRAGATRIVIRHDGANLSIYDDGCGISDFQKLLTNSESGWGSEVMKQDHPFGMGWFSTLFSAETVSVESHGQKCVIDTKSLIETQCDIAVEESDDDFIGTEIKLLGFTLPVDATKRALNDLAMGFPIPVIFNDTPIDRPHALDVLNGFRDFEYGKVCLRHEDGNFKSGSSAYKLYLQGLPVAGPHDVTYLVSEQRNVVHLNDAFKVRMPDRDSLINEEGSSSRDNTPHFKIGRAIETLWREILIDKKTKLSAEDFVQYLPSLQKFKLMELLNDIPVLPGSAFNEIRAYPTNQLLGKDYDGNITRSMVESNQIRVLTNYNYLVGKNDGLSYAIQMFMMNEPWVSIRAPLDEGHWIFQYAVDLNQTEVTIERTPKKTGDFYGSGVSASLEIVDDLTIHIGSFSKKLTDTALGIEDEFMTDQTIIVAGNASVRPDVLRQLTDFTDDGLWREEWEDEDNRSLDNTISILLGEPPHETISKVLNNAFFTHSSHCANSSSVVSVDDKSRLTSKPLEQVLQDFLKSAKMTCPNEKVEAFIASLHAPSMT